LQKVLEKEGKAKMEKCNHPTPQHDTCVDYYYIMVGGSKGGLDKNRGRRVLKFDHVGTKRGFTMGTP